VSRAPSVHRVAQSRDRPIPTAEGGEIALRFTEHAVDRMLDWDVEVIDVVNVVADGETIEEYDDGSRLVLGRTHDARPLHVVLNESQVDTTVVVTVYEPSPLRWDPTFRIRTPR
jgi:hypothetical protein